MPGPQPDPHLRAADADRQAVADRLGQHLSEGRLTLEEYDQRVAAAYAARTYGELDALFADLPRPAPAPRVPAAAGGPPVRPAGHVRGAWRSWTTVAVLVTAIWLFSSIGGGFHYFWPIWVVGPWGAVLLARTLGGGPPRRRDRRRC